MKFLSIKEYFYKLNTIGFILLLVPLVVFVFLYYESRGNTPMMPDQESVKMLLVIMAIVLFLDLTIVHWLFRSRVKKMKKLIEVAQKMDGFYSVTMMRAGVYCLNSLMSAVCFYLTGNSIFTGIFALLSLANGLQWPSPNSFCRHFDLKGSVREIIMNGGDVIKKK